MEMLSLGQNLFGFKYDRKQGPLKSKYKGSPFSGIFIQATYYISVRNIWQKFFAWPHLIFEEFKNKNGRLLKLLDEA